MVCNYNLDKLSYHGTWVIPSIIISIIAWIIYGFKLCDVFKTTPNCRRTQLMWSVPGLCNVTTDKPS